MLENLLGTVVSASTSTGTHVAKLIASDAAGSDSFGESVAMSATGSVFVIGAPGDDDKGASSGSAYVFKSTGENTWAQSAKLVASDGATVDILGSCVDISDDGTRVVVGSYMDDDRGSASGSAYIFRNTTGNTWIQAAKLTASDGAANDQFSISVSMSGSGDTCLIGARYDGDKGNQSGSAYVFKNTTGDTWVQVAKVVASDGTAGDNFGHASAISDDGLTAIVGARYDNPKGSNSGSAYVFRNTGGNTWSQVAKLSAGDGAIGDRFGETVAISGDGKTVLIQSMGDSDKGSLSGSAYLFRNTTGNTWAQEHKFVAADGAPSAEFGKGLSLNTDGNMAIIGANKDDDKGTYAGSAYIYKKETTWELVKKVVDSNGANYQYFGIATAIAGDGSVCLIGSGGIGHDGSYKGAVFVYK